MDITITEKAAKEVKRIQEEQGFKPGDKVYLRLRVLGAGCAGFQTKLDLDEEINEKLDETFLINEVNVVVDKRSGLYVNGAIIDFHDDINKRGFVVNNPSSKTTCGCGSSFSL